MINAIKCWNTLYAYIPLGVYLLLCLFTPSRQLQLIPLRRHQVLDARLGTNLTLVGFSFTVISLIVTLFQSQLGTVYESVFLFSLSLAYFFGSYLFLFLRLKRFFDTMSEGLTLGGLWVTIAGLRALLEAFEPLRNLTYMFTVLLVLLSAYIALDVYLKWKARKEAD